MIKEEKKKKGGQFIEVFQKEKTKDVKYKDFNKIMCRNFQDQTSFIRYKFYFQVS